MPQWNYRVVAVPDEISGELNFGIYEVYYDEANHPVSRTENPTTVLELSLLALKTTIGRFQEALDQAVMVDEFFFFDGSCCNPPINIVQSEEPGKVAEHGLSHSS